MASTPGRNRIWIALSGLYLLLLVGVALFYLLDPELSAEDKLLTTVGVAAVPAVAFVAAAAPLLRKSRNRLALRGGAAFAWIAAFFQLMLTFGIALPLSLVLLGVAVGDLRRARRLSRIAQIGT
jgi:hypothetical protein